MLRQWALLTLGVIFVSGQALWRASEQQKLKSIKTRTGVSLLKTYDLRNTDLVLSVLQARESDEFRDRIRRKQGRIWYWPGLKAAQISWVWMQTLNGLHTETSFRGDYSWLFSKIDFLSRSTPRGLDARSLSLAPFFLVIGVDGIGSTLMVRDWIRNYPDNWKTWFYAGYHALDNLKLPKLAADYFERGLKFKETPDYIAPLVLRLRDKVQIEDKKNRDLLLRDLDPALLERLRRFRPEWFTD